MALSKDDGPLVHTDDGAIVRITESADPEESGIRTVTADRGSMDEHHKSGVKHSH